MTARTPEDVAAMLDDLWGVAFRLRDVLMLVETQLSGKDGQDAPGSTEKTVGLGSVPVNPETQLSGQDGGGESQTVAPARRTAPVKPDAVVPANPVGGIDVNNPPLNTTSGGDFIPGTDSKYGESVQEGTKLRYHAGPCRTCGRPVRMIAKPRVGAEGTYRCWSCIKVRPKVGGRR